jgi:hypothetical protein
MRNCLLLVLLFSSTLAQAQKRIAKGSGNMIDGHHIVSFTPICGIVAYDNFNPGFGMEYEYILSQEAGIGLRLPFAFGYSGQEQDFTYYSGSGYTYKHTSVYAAPGIRFHGTFRNKNADFATGPAIILGNMHFSPYNYNGNYTVLPESYDYGMTGIMADNSLNFYRNHFMFGFDVRVGALMEVREDSRFFIHFGMHFGGIF